MARPRRRHHRPPGHQGAGSQGRHHATDHGEQGVGSFEQVLRWLTNEDIITGSPCLGIERPAPEVVRDRILTDPEVRGFWRATDDLPMPFGDIYTLLLLSAARRQEVAEMQWRELDLANKTWTISAERAKGKLAVVLPLGPLAWSIINAAAHRRVGLCVRPPPHRFQPHENSARPCHQVRDAMADA